MKTHEATCHGEKRAEIANSPKRPRAEIGISSRAAGTELSASPPKVIRAKKRGHSALGTYKFLQRLQFAGLAEDVGIIAANHTRSMMSARSAALVVNNSSIGLYPGMSAAARKGSVGYGNGARSMGAFKY